MYQPSRADLRIAIISDQPLCRDALAQLSRSALGAATVETFPRVEDYRAAGGAPPELLLVDPQTETDAGRSLAALEADAGGSVAVLLIPSLNPALARVARRRGFRGVLPKTSETPIMVAALHLMLAGGEYFPCFDEEDDRRPSSAPRLSTRAALSKRQAEILAELEAGATNKEIARKLGISLATVKMHVRALLGLVGARNRTEAVARFRRMVT